MHVFIIICLQTIFRHKLHYSTSVMIDSYIFKIELQTKKLTVASYINVDFTNFCLERI